jgi:prevent-host-death family protein
MADWNLQDAKNRFSAVVNAALAGEPQTVTRRGVPAVVVLAVDDYERLCQAEKSGAPTFIEHLLAIPKDGAEDLFDRVPLKLRDVEW